MNHIKRENHSFVKKARQQNMAFVVDEPCGLLEFLLCKINNQSRNSVKSILARGEVSVDGLAVTQYNFPLQSGQSVIIRPPSLTNHTAAKDLDILFEDADIIVINKPSGLLSMASDNEKIRTAYHLLTGYVKQTDPQNRVFIVHRLDRDTSGVMMIAKNENIKRTFQDRWAQLVSERGYIALVEGQPEQPSGIIKSWLRETKTHMTYGSRTPGDGLEAITRYQVIKQSSKYALLDIRLQTGRKNQIRVHMKDLGHSIAGDKMYGAATNPLKRLCLHAHLFEFTHPHTNEVMRFETKIPRSFMELLKK